MRCFIMYLFLSPIVVLSQLKDSADHINDVTFSTFIEDTGTFSILEKPEEISTRVSQLEGLNDHEKHITNTTSLKTGTGVCKNRTTSSLVVNNLSPYQILQRDASGNANIFVEGTYTGSPSGIEARWNSNETWTTLSLDTDGAGTFSGILQNQFQGQGPLEVRFSEATHITDTINFIGVGDIFIIAGQSNASGRGSTLNTSTHPSLQATLFGNDDIWKELEDKVDDDTGQIDVVSSDVIAEGSPWPLIATQIMESQNIPVAFVPAAKGSTIILQWRAAENHSDPTTLYGSMNRRITAVGGQVKAILFFQGESDADFGTSQEFYETELNTFVNTVAIDFPGLKTMVGQIGHSDPEGIDAVRAAQIKVLQTNGNTLLGPSTYDIDLSDEGGDTLHFKSDPDMEVYATRWYKAIEKEFYNGSNGYGPIVDPNNIVYHTSSNKITIAFTDDTTPILNQTSTVVPVSFDLINNEVSVPITSLTIIDNSIELTPSLMLDFEEPITVSYASSNKGVNTAIYDADNLPAENFYNLPVAVSTLGIFDSDLGIDLSVYPNPTTGFFTIDLGTWYPSATVRILSSEGKLVQFNSYEESKLLHFDITLLATGSYIVLVQAGSKKTTTRLLKK